jgi:hypothetical protein
MPASGSIGSSWSFFTMLWDTRLRWGICEQAELPQWWMDAPLISGVQRRENSGWQRRNKLSRFVT